MLTNLDLLLRRLFDPEYNYLLLEPLPLYGLFFGLLFFAVGLYLSQDKCRLVALVVIALCSFSIIPYGKIRSDATKRAASVQTALAGSIHAQTKLRNDTKWVYYSIGIAALVALIGGGKLGALGNYGVLALGLFGFIFSLWMHMKEAEVYHPNIRKAPVKAPAATTPRR